MTEEIHPLLEEGAIAPYSPPTISPIPQGGAMTPAQFMSELAALRQATLANTAAMQAYRPPQYHAPTYQAPQYGQYSPVFKPTIIVNTAADSQSHQDNSGGRGILTAIVMAWLVLMVGAGLSGGND